MMPGVDVAAELVRIAGVTLFAAALAWALAGPWRTPPMAIAIASTVLLAAGSIALLFATVLPFSRRVGEPLPGLALEYLLDTQHGPMLLVPVLPVVYALLLLHLFRQATSPVLRRAVAGLVGAMLLSALGVMAASGHVATTNWEHVGMVSQIVHMGAGVAWIAIVFSLLPNLVRGAPVAAELQRVGNVAAALVGVLVVSGVVAASLLGAPLPWSWGEPYERLLIIKTAVLAAALAAAGLNRLAVRSLPATETVRIRVTLVAETVVLAGALVFAAWLSRTTPPG